MGRTTAFPPSGSAQRPLRGSRPLCLCLLVLPILLALSCALQGGAAASNSTTTTSTNSSSNASTNSSGTGVTSGPPSSNSTGGTVRLSLPPPTTAPPPFNLTPSWEAFPVCQDPEIRSIKVSGSAVGNVTWKGWGTSLAWFANYIGGLPQAILNSLLDLIFAPTGLGLNIARYNIGGGFNPNISTQFNGSGPYAFRGMPGFKPTADGPYDWSADARQRAVLLGARDRGADTFIAFSNSPPWWMTNSGDVAGARVPYTSNMNSHYYGDFADYLTEVVRQYATNPSWNITFAGLEPFNEAQESPWTAGYNQEGCHMSIDDINNIILLVARALAAKGLSTRLVGIDSWTPFTASVLSQINPLVAALLSQIHVHGYTLPDLDSPLHAATVEATYGIGRAVGQAAGREVWVSEWGPYQRYGDYLDVGLFMARSIVESVNILGAASWTYWQVIDPTPSSWQLIEIPGEWNYSAPFRLSLNPQFFILKHFTTQVTPGNVPVTVPTTGGCHHTVAAFYHPEKSTVTVLIVNQQQFSDSLQLLVSGFVAATIEGRRAQVTVKAYRTTFGEYIKPWVNQTTAQVPTTIDVDLAPRSLTSVVLSGVSIAK